MERDVRRMCVTRRWTTDMFQEIFEEKKYLETMSKFKKLSSSHVSYQDL